jgi:hypothetical protein
MDRADIESRLAQAEAQVAAGEELIAQQRRAIDRLRHDGHPAGQAEKALSVLLAAQDFHTADRDRMRVELERAARGAVSDARPSGT